MRELIFRAKRTDTGEWVYGNVITSAAYPSRAWILDGATLYDRQMKSISVVEVVHETLGQYTGMNDKNHVTIFDGDIIQVPIFCSIGCNVLMKGIVEFHKSAFSVLWEDAEYGRRFIGYLDDMEVIGNIFDHPDLLPDHA